MGKIKEIREVKKAPIKVTTVKQKPVPKPRPVAKTPVTKKPVPKKPTVAKKGPVAKPVTRKKGKGIAVFIDLEDTNIRAINIVEILSELRRLGDVVYVKLYGYTDNKVMEFEEVIAENRLETIGGSRFRQGGVDTRLVVDAIRLTQAHKFGSVFVMAGQGDLASLFQYLKELGARTIAIDNPEQDVHNKFVDQRIRLFSQYHQSQPQQPAILKSEPAPIPEQEPEPEIPTIPEGLQMPKAILPPIDIMAGHKPPDLPRREGAPELGTQEAVSVFATPVVSDPVDELPSVFDNLSRERREEIANMPIEKRAELEMFMTAQNVLKQIDSEQKFEDEFSDINITPEPVIEDEPVPAPMPVPEVLEPEPPKPKFNIINIKDAMFDDFGDL